ncbi:uncharacterized protein ASPGLDRAFT_33486 [Aspergillus glaucus CBS 516.65]|uniref:Uncharacterized protein n=1 Tax=Aspergillus glaucus CBS 516.65 TaxID=1160497 RepID=A0A1L9VRM3_ASPGL|nr:hypothetical protein ASPGLDRAFT_33486 [Aspergillus glaucus CBS 516.65]OJJ86585.1 hypothetical protein ASPGLDRAFT_33486 [Aspergillus glaucus CBS 516.65]
MEILFPGAVLAGIFGGHHRRAWSEGSTLPALRSCMRSAAAEVSFHFHGALRSLVVKVAAGRVDERHSVDGCATTKNAAGHSCNLSNRIIEQFRSDTLNKPEGLLESRISRRGRIEHHFVIVGAISIVFVEVKKQLIFGKDGLDVRGQVLAECAEECDYSNGRAGHWTPILVVLCDGRNFEYIVMNSSDRKIYSTGWTPGIQADTRDKSRLLLSLKRVTENLFDWFLMSFMNGIRSLANLSSNRSKFEKRISTEKWTSSLASVERAHSLLRQADLASAETE